MPQNEIVKRPLLGLPTANGGEWKSPSAPDGEDWVLLVEKRN
jgi:hypothetical protein